MPACQQAKMTRIQARATIRVAWGFRVLRARASGGGLLGGGGPVQDKADLGEELGEVDRADAGQVDN